MILEIIPDDDPIDPRTYDNTATIVCWHKEYQIGDKHDFTSPTQFLKKHAGVSIFFTVYALIHSGITLSLTDFKDPWDSGPIGYIYISTKTAIDLWGEEYKTKAREVAMLEIETYNRYLQGDVWGYVIKDEVNNLVDSCFSYYDKEVARQDGEQVLKELQKKEREIATITYII